MGRKSIPFARESSLLRLRLSDVPGDTNTQCPLMNAEEEDDADCGVMASFRPGAPAAVTLEDLYRRNRDRARLIDLLHTHRASHGRPISAPDGTEDGEEGWPGEADTWLVQPQDRARLGWSASRFPH